jgi:small GTP-binding protein
LTKVHEGPRVGKYHLSQPLKMSRHRLVRNLVEDDYYDDYDDYDDDYYGEEEYGTTQQQNAPPPTKTVKPQAPKHLSGQLPVATKPFAPAAGRNKQVTGVAKPPPGWGKPPVSQAKPKTVSIGDSVVKATKPPPGWGKPEKTPAAVAVSIGGGGGGGGVSKPPQGWGKPDDATRTNENKTGTTITTKTPQPSQEDTNTKQQQQGKKPLPNFLKSKSQLSMVVVGHVDAGKSTLMGQLLVQVGQVTKRAAAKQGQLAWLLDEDESERERGVTMQIATKTFSTPNHGIVMLDAPGHADFIPIMITGAAHADVAILVVAAARGEFEAGFELGGQTKEHVILARGLGVSQVIVAVNKLDTEALNWDQARYEEIQYKVREYLLQQQFAPKRIRFIPVSGLTGENVKDVSAKNEKLRSWYRGPTLLEAINGYQPANRHIGTHFVPIRPLSYSFRKRVLCSLHAVDCQSRAFQNSVMACFTLLFSIR